LRLLIIGLSLMLLSQMSAAGQDSLPRFSLSRYPASGGEEVLSLSCYPGAGNQGYYCDVVKTRNGVVAATAGIEGPQVDRLLRRFFASLPASAPEPGRDPALAWKIQYGEKKSEGAVPRFQVKGDAGKIKSALFTLEAGLITRFYQ
jgi:hypothetical protein